MAAIVSTTWHNSQDYGHNALANLRVVIDQTSYALGSFVRVRLNGDLPDFRPGVNLSISVRRVAGAEVFRQPISAGRSHSWNEYSPAWQIPVDAPTGLYAVRLEALGSGSNASLTTTADTKFTLFRPEIELEGCEADHRFYTAGDTIELTVSLVNHGLEDWEGLRVEAGESQYPWISLPHGGNHTAFQFPEAVQLRAGDSRVVRFSGPIPKDAKPGPLHFTASVRSEDGARLLAFRSASTVYLRQPNAANSPTYPFPYLHSDLSQVQVGGYRSFYGDSLTDVMFETDRTSFICGEPGTVRFQASKNQIPELARVELRSAAGELIDEMEVIGTTGVMRAELRFGENPGLYQVLVQLLDSDWEVYETGVLEVSANKLPSSIAVICPHPDDEFLHQASIRAAVENSVPVHLVFLTNGDAGGSDRFFGNGYGPAEAIEFGHIRMAEAKAAAKHLGIAEKNLHFLGLPDGFLEAIRLHSEDAPPVHAPLLAVDHAPYDGLVQPNVAFTHRHVSRVLQQLLSRIDPEVVYTSHPDERHADHRAASLLTIEALQNLLSRNRLSRVPSVRTDQFYGPGIQEPAPFTYNSHEFFASGESMARTQEAYWFYQTQGGNHARGHVLSYTDLPRIEHHQEIVDWYSASDRGAATAKA